MSTETDELAEFMALVGTAVPTRFRVCNRDCRGEPAEEGEGVSYCKAVLTEDAALWADFSCAMCGHAYTLCGADCSFGSHVGTCINPTAPPHIPNMGRSCPRFKP